MTGTLDIAREAGNGASFWRRPWLAASGVALSAALALLAGAFAFGGIPGLRGDAKRFRARPEDRFREAQGFEEPEERWNRGEPAGWRVLLASGGEGEDPEAYYGRLRDSAIELAEEGFLRLPVDPSDARASTRWILGAVKAKRELETRRRAIQERGKRLASSGAGSREAAEVHRDAEQLRREAQGLRRQALQAFAHMDALEEGLLRARESETLSDRERREIGNALEFIGHMRGKRNFWREIEREIERVRQERGPRRPPPPPPRPRFFGAEGGWPGPPPPGHPRRGGFPGGPPEGFPHGPPPPPRHEEAAGLRARLEAAQETSQRLDAMSEEIGRLREETRLLREEISALRAILAPAEEAPSSE